MKKYILAYCGYEKLEIDESLANALIEAANKGIPFVDNNGRSFSTNFSWIIPKGEKEPIRFIGDKK